MNARHGLLSLLLSTTAAIITVASCAPDRGSVNVRSVRGGSPVSQGQDLCQGVIPANKAKRVDENTKAPNGVSLSITVCQAKDTDAPGAYARLYAESPASETPVAAASPTPKPVTYEPAKQQLRYVVSNHEGRLAVELKVGVELPLGTPDATSSRVLEVIEHVCLPSVTSAWDEKRLGLALDLSISQRKFSLSDEPGVDQVLVLAGPAGVDAAKLTAESIPSFVMAQWPDRGELIPFALPSAHCAKTDGGCAVRAIREANIKFCQTFSRAVGQWLGLNGADGADGADGNGGACGAPSAMAQPPSNAKFSATDITSILRPVCKIATPLRNRF